MTVNEIISLLSKLGLGLDDPTPLDAENNLIYINLAYAEIMRKTFLNNPYVRFSRETLACVAGVLVDTASAPMIIKSIYLIDSNTPLVAANIDSIQEDDPAVSKTGTPCYWYYANNQINVYPLYDGNIGILYVPTPAVLVAGGAENTILFNRLYHQILVDGACYYLFQSEGGFKSTPKLEESLRRWENGKEELFAYLKSLAGQQNFSTYSAV